MSLYKRGATWHYDFTIDGIRHRGSTGFKLKKDADAFADAHRRALILGIASPDQIPTVGEVADKWFASRIAQNKTATTVAQRIKILFRHLDPNLPVDQVSHAVIEDAILSRRREPIRQGAKKNPRPPAPATVNRDMIDTTLRPILAYAEEMEHPIRRIKWGKLRLAQPPGLMPILSDDVRARWRAALPEWHRPLFDFFERYGPRLKEAFFHPDCLNVEAAEVYLLNTKNGRNHALILLEEDVPDLAARKARAVAAGLDTIWFRDDGGRLTPIHWRAFQSASKQALRAAGIKGVRPVHDLRHHAATTLARDSGSLRLVQQLLNHQNIASAARYSQVTKDDLRSAMRHAHGTTAAQTTETYSKFKEVSRGGTVT
ncbi:tyrosine-type recombinase/integrase [Caulobacter sp. SLTY]|uniref:tyrosine-type recombinase/integrase n=1 Tax=Caulobacter sp. SLTY TaxID=2683262 RepID=UPI0014123DCD|nr:tyrosine-type recombinase/integrase [Caulobacter sp. SLTY]NBB16295.1 tyrosine-type recombinase/integrase [Caulobacter sp. SLTY]